MEVMLYNSEEYGDTDQQKVQKTFKKHALTYMAGYVVKKLLCASPKSELGLRTEVLKNNKIDPLNDDSLVLLRLKNYANTAVG